MSWVKLAYKKAIKVMNKKKNSHFHKKLIVAQWNLVEILLSLDSQKE